MTLAAQKPATESAVTWFTVDEVANSLMLSPRRVRQLCNFSWKHKGRARKVRGAWTISQYADPKLSGIEFEGDRDNRQIGELTREGVADREIDVALKRREIVQGFLRFSGNARTEKGRRCEYLGELKRKKVIPCPGIDRLSERTLRRWCELYSKGQDLGGVRGLTRRARPKQDAQLIGDRAWDFFLNVKHTGTDITISAAFDQTLGYVLEQHLTDTPGWAWPSLRTVYLAYRLDVPEPVKVYGNRGKRAFQASCIPKIRRGYVDCAAGDVLVGDERIFDCMAVVCGERGPRRVRLKLSAWLDARSRKLAGWHIGVRANADTILSSFKAACLSMGTLPRSVIMDNGLDYRAVGGPSRRHRHCTEQDSSRLQTAFQHLGVEVTYAEPHHPWAKIIESHFRPVKEGFDKFAPAYWGGSPFERPEDAEAWTKAHIDKLWTVDDVREHFATWLETHHATPANGSGMRGLTPDQAARQFFTEQPRYVSEDTLRLLCCRRVKRRVGRDGVRLDGVLYGTLDKPVFLLQKKDVWVAIDPAAGDRVMFCNEDGTPICEANAYNSN